MSAFRVSKPVPDMLCWSRDADAASARRPLLKCSTAGYRWPVSEALRMSRESGVRQWLRNLRGLVYQLFLLAKALAVPVAFGVAGRCMMPRAGCCWCATRYMPGWRLPGGGVGRGEAAAGRGAARTGRGSGPGGRRGGIFRALYAARPAGPPMWWRCTGSTGAAVDFHAQSGNSAILFADPHDAAAGLHPGDPAPAGGTVRRAAAAWSALLVGLPFGPAGDSGSP